MTESDCLRSMFLYEAGSRLGLGSEVTCLAAHLYHRYFRTSPETYQCELYTFEIACLKLALWFYDTNVNSQHISDEDLALVMISVAHGTDCPLYRQNEKKIIHSINLAMSVVCINLRYQIDYSVARRMTPGEVERARLGPKKDPVETETKKVVTYTNIEDQDDDEDDDDLNDPALTLANNPEETISSHRYLTHYLVAIKLLIDNDLAPHFSKLCTISWTILCDQYWSSRVTQYHVNHMACAALMLAISMCRAEYENSRINVKSRFWRLINKKWNLIFCNDLTQNQLNVLMQAIVSTYDEYDRILQHEFNTYVIDPNPQTNADMLASLTR